jgi:hypothetical protein
MMLFLGRAFMTFNNDNGWEEGFKDGSAGGIIDGSAVNLHCKQRTFTANSEPSLQHL